MADTDVPELIEQLSSLPFADTVQRLVEKIGLAGLTLFATIDHAANARAVGLTMPPATVLIYGNAKGGTPVMLAAPLTALDLPLHALVQQRRDGTVIVAFHPIVPTLLRAGAARDIAATLGPAQRLLVAAVAP